MKLTEQKSRVVGMATGEIEVDLVHGGGTILRVKYMLLREDGSACGSFTKTAAWSDTTMQLLHQLLEQLESDALPELFQITPSDVVAPTAAPDTASEPEQF